MKMRRPEGLHQLSGLPVAHGLFMGACSVLSEVIPATAALLETEQLAAVTELVVRFLWLGLHAPKGSDSEVARAHREVCAEPGCIRVLLSVIEALHRPPR